MAPEKLRKSCLLIGGIASGAMAAFHFVLPHVFGWARFVDDIPPPIRWGLFSINVFFSSLLLWGGLITIIATLKDKDSSWLDYIIFSGMGIFWIINATYQGLYPFPVAIMRWVLLGFGISVALLYIVGVLLSFGQRSPKRRVTV